MDFYNFYCGFEFNAYEFLGAHYSREATVFRVFAPSADRISLLINDGEYPMNKIYNDHFYELSMPNIQEGTLYEYRVYTGGGSYTDHAAPYGFGMELRPAHKSVVRDIGAYSWGDQKWLKNRTDAKSHPLNIYEIHLGSFRKPSDEPESWYNYEEIGDILIPYLKDSGYNCVEFMPLSEHPCDESWGYQNTGFYAPTARYGTARSLQTLVDRLHQNNIGVILDFVPVHFAVDSYGLARFDGTALYEYPSADVGYSEWGSCNFIYARGEVRSFLQSAANYWLSEYHFDGLRMDAVSRVIYWQGEEYRGENRNAIDFIKVMNGGLKERHPNCMLIAEDSTNFPKVTAPTQYGGLGFDYKWNMGWMHDTLEFFQCDPLYRTDNYHKLTFSMLYAYNEKYLLPFSHDEVVHGKATIAQKMNGQYEEKFPQARVLYLYMMMHPGKKLNFMGSEIAQLREWDEKREQDWFLRKYPIHDSFYSFITTLNKLYLSTPALYEKDYDPSGFEWLDCHCEQKCVYAMRRYAFDGSSVCAVLNLSKQSQTYYIPFGDDSEYKVILNTDWQRFGGSTPETQEICTRSKPAELPPYCAVLLSKIQSQD